MLKRKWNVVVAAVLGLAAVSSGAQAQEGVTALVNANLIDGRGNAPLANQTILIADGRISAVFPSGSRPLPNGTRIIDLTGQTVLPGLIEGHVHQPFLGRELSRLVECGLSPLDAIRAATYNNAKAMGLEQSIGSIEVGKRADLLVLAADPASDISRINDVRMVMKNGTVVNIAD